LRRGATTTSWWACGEYDGVLFAYKSDVHPHSKDSITVYVDIYLLDFNCMFFVPIPPGHYIIPREKFNVLYGPAQASDVAEFLADALIVQGEGEA